MKKYHPLRELCLVRMRTFYREPEAIFWVYVFPLLLAIGLGIAFRQRPPQVIAVVVPDHTPPRITQVQVTGSAWSAEFMAHLAATGQGSGGRSIPGGPPRLQAMPWGGMERMNLALH